MGACARRLHGQAHVFQNGEIGEQVCQLKGPAQARAGAARRAHAVQAVAVEVDLTTASLDLARDQVEERGLAGPIGANDGCQRAGPEGAAHTVHGHVPAEAHGQVFGN